MITIDDFKANTKEWLIDKLESLSQENALQTISNLYNELHKPKYPKTKDLRDILLKDLYARLPYGVKISDSEGNTVNIVGIYKDTIIIPYAGITQTILADNCKPYLFPLSSMTREQMDQFNKTLIGTENLGWSNETFDWCNKNYFDYRDLIPMSLAIDATGLNIY